MHSLRGVLSLLGAALFAALLVSCSGAAPAVRPAAAPTPSTLTAERPKEEPFRTELKKEVSSLGVTIETTSDQLSGMLNQMIAKELYKGASTIKGVTVEALRNGPVLITAADNYLFLSMPVTLSLNYGIFKTPVIPLNLKFKAHATVTPDWRLVTDIAYTGLSDLMAEQVGIGPLSIKPRSIVEGITQPVQKLVSEVVSKKLNEKLALRAQVAKAWNAAQKPVLLDNKYGAWLKIVPKEVMLYPLSARNNRVKISVGMKTLAEVVVGPEPAPLPPVALPNLKLVNASDNTFRIALNTDLFYRDLLAIASPLVLNKDFGTDGKSVIVKEFDLYGNGDKIVVKVATTGSIDGVFYLTGKPGFDQTTNLFSVRDVDFDMNTQSLLLNSADWFLHGTIRDRIQEKLNMDLTTRLADALDMARKAVAQVKLVDHVVMNGNIRTLKVNDVMVQKDRISLQVYTEGETALVLQ